MAKLVICLNWSLKCFVLGGVWAGCSTNAACQEQNLLFISPALQDFWKHPSLVKAFQGTPVKPVTYERLWQKQTVYFLVFLDVLLNQHWHRDVIVFFDCVDLQGDDWRSHTPDPGCADRFDWAPSCASGVPAQYYSFHCGGIHPSVHAGNCWSHCLGTGSLKGQVRDWFPKLRVTQYSFRRW